MSLLADLLAKSKSSEPQGEREIPPTLANSFGRQPEPAGGTQRRYILLAAILAAVLLTGVAALTQYDKIVSLLNPKPVTPIPPIAKPAPPAPAIVKQESAALQKPLSSAIKPPLQTAAVTALDKQIITKNEPEKSVKQITKKRTRNSKTPKAYMKSSIKPFVPPQIKRSKSLNIVVSPAAGAKVIPPVDATKRDSLLYAARAAELSGEWRIALANYRAALELDSENFKIMSNIAAALNNLGRFSEGVTEAKRALAKRPDYVPAMINAAVAYSSSGNSMEGLLLLENASKADPGNRHLSINLGIMQERTGKLDEAMETYRQLAANGDNNALLGMGRIYEQRGYKQEASKIYRKISGLTETSAALKKELKERMARLRE